MRKINPSALFFLLHHEKAHEPQSLPCFKLTFLNREIPDRGNSRGIEQAQGRMQ